VLHVASVLFMIPYGLSSAAAVRVGQAVGRGDAHGRRVAGWAAITIGLTFAGAASVLLVATPESFLRLFTSDASVLALLNTEDKQLLARLSLALADLDVIELNEAFAAQGLAVLRQLGLEDEDPRVNPNGGAIALGHPLGMSGARLALTATEELQGGSDRYALCTMCIGVGQGIVLALERV